MNRYLVWKSTNFHPAAASCRATHRRRGLRLSVVPKAPGVHASAPRRLRLLLLCILRLLAILLPIAGHIISHLCVSSHVRVHIPLLLLHSPLVLCNGGDIVEQSEWEIANGFIVQARRIGEIRAMLFTPKEENKLMTAHTKQRKQGKRENVYPGVSSKRCAAWRGRDPEGSGF
jgi:hypothetical protein